MGLYQLICFSIAARPVDRATLREILATARSGNAKLGVNGLLIFGDGYFLQALEGEEETVRRLYRRIAADPRHTDCAIIFEGEVPAPEFDGWSMGFYGTTGPGDALLASLGIRVLDRAALHRLRYDRSQARSLMAAALAEAEREAA